MKCLQSFGILFQFVYVHDDRLRSHARRLAIPIQTSDTPTEFLVTFAKWAKELGQEEHLDNWPAPVIRDAHSLIDCYVQTIYASRPPCPRDQAWIIQKWRNLCKNLWLARLKRVNLFGRRVF